MLLSSDKSRVEAQEVGQVSVSVGKYVGFPRLSSRIMNVRTRFCVKV